MTVSLGACDLIIGAGDRKLGDTIDCEAGACQCAEGLADCDGDPENGCETDIALDMVGECDGDPATLCETKLGADGENCGQCGHSCLGGECKDGLCVPQSVPGTTGVYEFVLQGNDFYYTSFYQGGLFKTTIGGGAGMKIADAADPGRMLRLHKGTFYFATEKQILSVPMAGGQPQVLANGFDPIIRLAVGGDKIYWVDLTDNMTGATRLMRATLAPGGTPEELTKFEPFNQIGSELVATDTDIYFTDGINIVRTPHASAMKQIFAVAPGPPAYYVQDGGDLYIDCYAQGVYRTPLAAMAMFTKLADDAGEGALAVDGANVYYLSTEDYLNVKLFRVAKDGGLPVLLASSKDIVYSEPLVLDDTWVYWLTEGLGVQRVPK